MIDFHTHDRTDAPPVLHDNLAGKLESFGDMYQDQNGPDIIVTVANTYYPWINGEVDIQYPWLLIDRRIVHELLYVKANDSSITGKFQSFEITQDVAGWYHLSFNVSFECDMSGSTRWSVFINNLKTVFIATATDTTAGDLFTAAASGLVRLNVGDIIELRTSSNQTGAAVTPLLVNFHLHRIAKLITQA